MLHLRMDHLAGRLLKIIFKCFQQQEIFLNLRAANAASKFGLCEVLQLLGKKSKKSQESALKKKELDRLYPTNLIFLEGSMKALMSSYIECFWTDNFQPTVEGFISFCLESKNPKTKALFLTLYHFGLPALVKRLGIRLHRNDIADGGSALGK